MKSDLVSNLGELAKDLDSRCLPSYSEVVRRAMAEIARLRESRKNVTLGGNMDRVTVKQLAELLEMLSPADAIARLDAREFCSPAVGMATDEKHRDVACVREDLTEEYHISMGGNMDRITVKQLAELLATIPDPENTTLSIDFDNEDGDREKLPVTEVKLTRRLTKPGESHELVICG